MTKPDRGVALVTGASTGIGRATAEALRDAGYRVFGTSRKSVPQALGRHHHADGRRDRVTRPWQNWSMTYWPKRGELTCSSITPDSVCTGAAEESSIAQVRSLFETNFYGVVRVTNAVLPIMRKQRDGRILNVGSVSGARAGPLRRLLFSE